MSHYAIIKRQKCLLKPEWNESVKEWDYVEKVKYEDVEYSTSRNKYVNVICKAQEGETEEVVFWEGNVSQEILNRGEKLIVLDEVLTISDVEKHVNGNVTYYADELLINVENYDELLAECEKQYEEYSSKLKAETEAQKKLEKDYVTSKNPFTVPVQVKSRWKRFFERR